MAFCRGAVFLYPIAHNFRIILLVSHVVNIYGGRVIVTIFYRSRESFSKREDSSNESIRERERERETDERKMIFFSK